MFNGRTLQRVPQGLSAIVSEAAGYDCVIVGEVHDDPVAHLLELELLANLHEECKSTARGLTVSLEFFERDVQPVMDEYLQGLCRERDMVKDARAWPNYSADYRALVEFCKAHGLRIVCANAPRRHVGLAGREGAESLLKLPLSVKAFLPPLPFPSPSARYIDKFLFTMQSMQAPSARTEHSEQGAEQSSGQCPYVGLSLRSSKMLDAQSLWDAAMAHSIHEELASARKDSATGAESRALVMHICGKFHCEHALGIPERLADMSLPERAGHSRLVKTLVVCIEPAAPEHLVNDVLPDAARDMADYIVLSDATLPRSFDVAHPV